MAKITVETRIHAPADRVWQAWNTPAEVMQWNAASDDWHTTHAEVDLREGGRFTSRMEAKDGSMGFDFTGVYGAVIPEQRIEYAMEDGRTVQVTFINNGDGSTMVRETFDAESVHSEAQQRQGWQAILDNFKRHVENKT